MNDDTKDVVAERRRTGITPQAAKNTARSGGSAIDGHSSRHVVLHQIDQYPRGIGKLFGWIKPIGGLSQFQLRGQDNVSAVHSFSSRSLRLRRRQRLWPACDRFHPDPQGQPALGAASSAGVARDGGNMTSSLPRGVRQRVENQWLADRTVSRAGVSTNTCNRTLPQVLRICIFTPLRQHLC